DGWSLFAQLPATARQSGDVSLLTSAPAFGFGVGDIRVGLRHLLRPGFAAQLSVEAPTAQLQSFTGDDRLAVEGLISGAQRRGKVEFIGNLFLRFRAPRDLLTARLGNELGLRGGVAVYSGQRRAYLELELQPSLRGVSLATFPVEWRAGATFCAFSTLALDAAFGTRLDDAVGSPS